MTTGVDVLIPRCGKCQGTMAQALAPGSDPYWVCLCCGGGGIMRDRWCRHGPPEPVEPEVDEGGEG